MYVPAYNPGDAPVVIDFEGRTLGGREWGAVDRHDPAVVDLLDRDALIVTPLAVADVDDAAQGARDAGELAGILEDRRKALTDLPVAELRALADPDDDDDDELDDLGRAHLVRHLTRRLELDVPDAGSTPDPEPPPPTLPTAKATPAKAAATTRKANP